MDLFGFLQWNVKKLCFEYDTDPYYQALDIRVQVSSFVQLFLFLCFNVFCGVRRCKSDLEDVRVIQSS